MLINGKARMACSALSTSSRDKPEQPIKLAPLSKFPVVRDLAVDRSVLFENLKTVKAWVPIDGTYDLGAGPRQFPQIQEQRYPLSNCISCTICMEVCPQFNDSTNFVGAATIAQASSSTWTPPAPSSKKSASAPSPATAASRSAASPRTASRPAPNNSPSPKPSPTWAATSSSSKSKTSPANTAAPS
jgi:succinate dehydrogenase/fumarate reductase-like Fe-S protein